MTPNVRITNHSTSFISGRYVELPRDVAGFPSYVEVGRLANGTKAAVLNLYSGYQDTRGSGALVYVYLDQRWRYVASIGSRDMSPPSNLNYDVDVRVKGGEIYATAFHGYPVACPPNVSYRVYTVSNLRLTTLRPWSRATRHCQ